MLIKINFPWVKLFLFPRMSVVVLQFLWIFDPVNVALQQQQKNIQLWSWKNIEGDSQPMGDEATETLQRNKPLKQT